MKATEKAYTAAAIDGDGSIMIGSTGHMEGGFGLMIELGQMAPGKPMAEYLHSLWGGRMITSARNSGTYWQWTVGAKMGKKLLLKCLPYFQNKKGQARLGIAFQILRDAWMVRMRSLPSSQRQVPEDLLLLYQRLRFMMKSLNGRGTEGIASATETEREGLIAEVREYARQLQGATVRSTRIEN